VTNSNADATIHPHHHSDFQETASTCSRTEPLGITAQIFMVRMPFMTPNQWCRDTQRDKEQWSQTGKLTHWNHALPDCWWKAQWSLYSSLPALHV